MSDIKQQFIILLMQTSTIITNYDRPTLNTFSIELAKVEDGKLYLLYDDILDFVENLEVEEEDEPVKSNIIKELGLLNNKIKRPKVDRKAKIPMARLNIVEARTVK